jgi:hypothetical protein
VCKYLKLFSAGLWIRIHIGSGFDKFVDSDYESGFWIKGEENEEKCTGTFCKKKNFIL